MFDVGSTNASEPARLEAKTNLADDQASLGSASFSAAQQQFREAGSEIDLSCRPSPANEPVLPPEGGESAANRNHKVRPWLRNDFHEHAKPYIIDGRPDRPTLLFYGGLAGTGWAWKEFAAGLNHDCGNRVEVYSLSGHDGEWESLVMKSQADWVGDIIEKAEACKQYGIKPVFFGYSTSAVAAIEAAALRPDLFGALVLIGTPIDLKDWKSSLALNVVEWVDHYVPFAHKLFQKIPVSLPPDPPGIDPDNILAKQPSLEQIPLSTLISLVRLQRDARAMLQDVRCPVLVIQGTQDKYVDLKIAERMFKLLASEQKEFVAVEESPHAVMLGKRRESIKSIIEDWFIKLRGDPRPEPNQ